ncbi:protein CutA homolog isoform X2 [Phyllostomus discolor]|uniref:Protein CutA homolog isoform X2 n=1 Tax=Phyllostomus discolor TaxID=89673 RepID=A0A7E6DG62_9CHIR|nr:protein CutA homolog isoform X2 [Phyllostomus discolor]
MILFSRSLGVVWSCGCLQIRSTECQPDTYLHEKSRNGVTKGALGGEKAWELLVEPSSHYTAGESGAVLGKKLAASVNILPEASSLYFWNGEIEEATEILLLIKTKTSKVHTLSSYVRLVHPFEIPEIFSLPMDQGDVHYLRWLKEGMEED